MENFKISPGERRFEDSRLAKLLKRIRRRGLRNGLNDIAAALARKHLRPSLNVLEDFGIVLSEDRPASLPFPQSGPLRINWILPSVAAGEGGLLGIFRTIRQLEAWGHQNRVYVMGRLSGSAKAVKEQIGRSYFPIDAEVKVLSDHLENCDALVATSWPTAYAARGIANTARKFYFVQDIECMFYASGSLCEFARKTYQFGFRGITLGSWIADVLRREFNMECTAFGFSYDRDAYASTGRRTLPPGKRRVLFYARPSSERRGFELGILTLTIVAKRMSNAEFVLIGFPDKQMDLPFPATLLGLVPVSELGALYRSCDLALVLSHTNLSLLPLELMACGCAVVSNNGPNVDWLLTDQTVQLAKPDPQSLAEAVIELLERDELRLRKIEAGLAFAQTTDWTKEIRTIESALVANREVPHRLKPRG